MDDLIRDDGELRECPHNLSRLGYWKSYQYFFGYKVLIKEVLPIFARQIIPALLLVFQFLIFILLFPIAPFIRCFFEVRRAKHEVLKEEADKTRL